ncbi:MAG: TIGR00730 family Rossman fold protein [Rhodospirillales bacterium]|jgi:uncharacterized protein (TIGR00730 family)|nr:TIGR00730 family Rossman fold protein [Rhodospirillales bacterium]MBT7770271.1 TIGR00730 family Rossman fold protein [Rhodospirillales bacterium]
MDKISSLCVFCGSRAGDDPAYSAVARELGAEMAKRNIRLVYGAGNIGLMGTLADEVHSNGGKITGIIPKFLDRLEVGRKESDEFIVTTSMHDRKAKMFEASDAFISLPGGLGTLDETFEIMTWRQLGLHDKPIIILDVNGYWTPLSELIETTIQKGFASESAKDLFCVVDSVDGVFDALSKAASSTEKPKLERL